MGLKGEGVRKRGRWSGTGEMDRSAWIIRRIFFHAIHTAACKIAIISKLSQTRSRASDERAFYELLREF